MIVLYILFIKLMHIPLVAKLRLSETKGIDCLLIFVYYYYLVYQHTKQMS